VENHENMDRTASNKETNATLRKFILFQVGSCVPIVFQGNTELFFAPSSTAGRFFLPSDVAWLQLGNFPVLAALTKKPSMALRMCFF
jgi:hypothetical protein